MHSEDLFIDDGSNWQTVETICESFPQFDVVPSFSFIIETVDSVDGSTLMVTSQDEKVLWVFDFIRQ